MVTQAEQHEAQLEQRLLAHPRVARERRGRDESLGRGREDDLHVPDRQPARRPAQAAWSPSTAIPAFGSLARACRLKPDSRNGTGRAAERCRPPLHRRRAGPYVSRLPQRPARPRGSPRLRPCGAAGARLVRRAGRAALVLLRGRDPRSRPRRGRAAGAVRRRRADQIVLVTTPDWAASNAALEALAHLQRPRANDRRINRVRDGPRSRSASWPSTRAVSDPTTSSSPPCSRPAPTRWAR